MFEDGLDKQKIKLSPHASQIRALEYGYKIKVVINPHDSEEVDNQQELDRARRIL